MFAFCREVSITNTRPGQTDLWLPLVKTNISKAKISYSDASLFNSLPIDLKTIENYTVLSFTIKLKLSPTQPQSTTCG